MLFEKAQNIFIHINDFPVLLWSQLCIRQIQ